MQIRKFSLAIFIYLQIGLHANSQDCFDNWTADVILQSAIDASTPTTYSNQKIWIRFPFKVVTHLILNNCDVRVDDGDRFAFDEGATIEIYDCTFKACISDWIGFRHTGTFSESVKADVKIKDSYFYDFSELFHVNMKEDSRFEFTGNTAVMDVDFTHILHFINHGSLENFKFFGNTLESPALSIDILTSVDWNIGDNGEDPNIIISGSNGPLLQGKSSAIQISALNASINFENCVFGAYDFGVDALNGSLSFNNCTFVESDYGYIDNSVSGATSEFEDCIFTDNSIGMHLSSGSAVMVDNCYFDDNNTGIKLSLPNQSTGSLNIDKSYFSNDIDVHCTGAFFEPVVIGETVFLGGTFGFLGDGESYYRLRNNDLAGSYISSFNYSNGEEDNLLVENEISGVVGVHSNGINNNFKFFNNCFSSQEEDMNLNGTVAPFMGYMSGNLLLGAGNCFTKGSVTDINHSGTSFDYLLPQSEYSTCHEPIYNSDYVIKDASDIDDKDCGSGYEPNTDSPYCYVSWDPTCQEVTSALSTVNGEISSVEGSGVITPYLKSIILDGLYKCKRTLILLKMRLCGGIVAVPDLPDHEDFEMRAKGLGFLISNEAYEDALDYLDTINPGNEYELDYVATQEINIRRLIERDTFELSSAEEDSLHYYGSKSHPLAAYARGLLTLLTGEIIYPDVELGDPVEPRSRVIASNGREYEAYPNPANDNLQVSTSNLFGTDRLLFYNATGSVMHQSYASDWDGLMISSWPTGLYLLAIVDSDGNVVYSEKIIKQ